MSLIGERSGVDQSDLEGHAATLHRLADGLPVNADRIRLLIGDPATTLTGMAAEQDYDLVVLGALTHRPQRPLVGTVTRQLMERLDCDFLLLRPGSFVSPVRGAKAGVAQTSMAPWRARFADEECIDTLRFLSVDAVEKANSGHPVCHWARHRWHMCFGHAFSNTIRRSAWFDRDRFVLSAGMDPCSFTASCTDRL